ncbi:MAG: flagellar hook-length control protein FliK [Halioglobus sp.]|nr:flagellar hook-length control protein FliK [Halioglobus sp.]
MIPILDSGALTSLDADQPGIVARNSADTGSGGSFSQILGSQGQPAQAGAENASTTAGEGDGGNPLQPGGKALPDPAAATVAEQAEAAFDVSALAGHPEALRATLQTAQPTGGSQPAVPIPTEAVQAAGLPAGASPEAGARAAPPPTTAAAAPQDTAAARAAQGLPVADIRAAAANPAPGTVAPAPLPEPSLAQQAEGSARAGVQGILPPAAQASPALLAPAAATSSPLQAPPVATPDAARAVGGQTGTDARGDAGRRPLDSGILRAAPDAPARPLVTTERAATNTPEQLAQVTRTAAFADDASVIQARQEAVTTLTAAEGGRSLAPPTPVAPQGVTGVLAPPALDASAPLASRIDGPAASASLASAPAWNSELAGRVSMMIRNGTAEASLQLNPPELGRMEIKIATEGDQARVMFVVQGAETREVIEQALPRLREMLEQGGLSLSRFDVSDHSRSPQGQGSDGEAGQLAGDAEADLSAGELLAAPTAAPSQSLVDYYV